MSVTNFYKFKSTCRRRFTGVSNWTNLTHTDWLTTNWVKKMSIQSDSLFFELGILQSGLTNHELVG